MQVLWYNAASIDVPIDELLDGSFGHVLDVDVVITTRVGKCHLRSHRFHLDELEHVSHFGFHDLGLSLPRDDLLSVLLLNVYWSVARAITVDVNESRLGGVRNLLPQLAHLILQLRQDKIHTTLTVECDMMLKSLLPQFLRNFGVSIWYSVAVGI